MISIASGCSSDNPRKNTSSESLCTDYPDWTLSPYALPYPVGVEYRISQGNCTASSHQGTLRYSYDIEMPFGSVVTSARKGVVHAIRIGQPEGTRGLTASNWIQIRHEDNMISEYVHLAPNSNRVQVGDSIIKGDTLALTGDTGDVGTWPHLHFDISPCGNNLTCGTAPITFRNTRTNQNGLRENERYKALEHKN